MWFDFSGLAELAILAVAFLIVALTFGAASLVVSVPAWWILPAALALYAVLRWRLMK